MKISFEKHFNKTAKLQINRQTVYIPSKHIHKHPKPYK